MLAAAGTAGGSEAEMRIPDRTRLYRTGAFGAT